MTIDPMLMRQWIQLRSWVTSMHDSLHGICICDNSRNARELFARFAHEPDALERAQGDQTTSAGAGAADEALGSTDIGASPHGPGCPSFAEAVKAWDRAIVDQHYHDGVNMEGSDIAMPDCPICAGRAAIAAAKVELTAARDAVLKEGIRAERAVGLLRRSNGYGIRPTIQEIDAFLEEQGKP